MNQITSLDVIQTMLGVIEASTSEESKRLAKDIVDREVKKLYERMIEQSLQSKGIINS